MMNRVVWVAGAALLLVSCEQPNQALVKAIVGAVLLDGTGGPPISDSVVTIEGTGIRATGSRSSLSVPAEAEKIDGAGKFIVPEPIDVARRTTGAIMVRPDVADGVLEKARQDHVPVIAEIHSLHEAQTMVERGATGFMHMIRDTEAIDPPFIARLRDLRVVFAPMLSGETNPAELAVAERNTRRLAEGGVLIAAASAGDLQRELDLLVAAGLPPSEVLVAATRNSARELGILDETGTIEPGKLANLLLLSANPAEDIGNLRKSVRVMHRGQWVEGTRQSGF